MIIYSLIWTSNTDGGLAFHRFMKFWLCSRWRMEKTQGKFVLKPLSWNPKIFGTEVRNLTQDGKNSKLQVEYLKYNFTEFLLLLSSKGKILRLQILIISIQNQNENNKCCKAERLRKKYNYKANTIKKVTEDNINYEPGLWYMSCLLWKYNFCVNIYCHVPLTISSKYNILCNSNKMSMKMAVFWVVVPCRLVWYNQHIRGLYRPDYTALQLRRQPSSQSLPLKHQVITCGTINSLCYIFGKCCIKWLFSPSTFIVMSYI
jgi:hypothetical protein